MLRSLVGSEMCIRDRYKGLFDYRRSGLNKSVHRIALWIYHCLWIIQICSTCCYQCLVSTRSMCAIITTVYRCWPSTNRSRISTSCCVVMRGSPSVKDGRLLPFSHIPCIRSASIPRINAARNIGLYWPKIIGCSNQYIVLKSALKRSLKVVQGFEQVNKRVHNELQV